MLESMEAAQCADPVRLTEGSWSGCPAEAHEASWTMPMQQFAAFFWWRPFQAPSTMAPRKLLRAQRAV